MFTVLSHFSETSEEHKRDDCWLNMFNRSGMRPLKRQLLYVADSGTQLGPYVPRHFS
jgi:hypothetical protein